MGAGAFFGSKVRIVLNEKNRLVYSHDGSIEGVLMQSKLAAWLVLRPTKDMEWQEGSQRVTGRRDKLIPTTSVAFVDVLEWGLSNGEEDLPEGLNPDQVVDRTQGAVPQKATQVTASQPGLLSGQYLDSADTNLPPASGPVVSTSKGEAK